MRVWIVVAALVVASGRDASAQFAMTFSSDPHIAIHRETWVDMTIPTKVRLMKIDLTYVGIGLYATPQSQLGKTTLEYSNLAGAAVAVNGDSFAINGYVPTGLAMGATLTGDPAFWSGTADDGTSAVFDFHREPDTNGSTHIAAEIIPPELITQQSSLPTGTQGVISGRPLLVRSGVAQLHFDCSDQTTFPCERAPRSAVALSADGHTMWIAVVDGWQTTSAGLTCPELSQFLVDHGADMAVAFDGGGSSTLVADGTLISIPSDGVERALANHLAVTFGPKPGGELLGLVCEKKLNPCVEIDAATVTLDDGQSQPTNTNGIFDFQDITPRLVCATARKTGYYPTKRCVYVTPSVQNFDSMALEPCPTGGCPTGTDAGTPDAPLVTPDASGLRDGGGGDGGNPGTGPGGGCCGAGRDRPELFLGVIVAWFLTRRRGTTA